MQMENYTVLQKKKVYWEIVFCINWKIFDVIRFQKQFWGSQTNTGPASHLHGIHANGIICLKGEIR